MDRTELCMSYFAFRGIMQRCEIEFPFFRFFLFLFFFFFFLLFLVRASKGRTDEFVKATSGSLLARYSISNEAKRRCSFRGERETERNGRWRGVRYRYPILRMNLHNVIASVVIWIWSLKAWFFSALGNFWRCSNTGLPGVYATRNIDGSTVNQSDPRSR